MTLWRSCPPCRCVRYVHPHLRCIWPRCAPVLQRHELCTSLTPTSLRAQACLQPSVVNMFCFRGYIAPCIRVHHCTYSTKAVLVAQTMRVQGKVVVITGTTSGLGFVAARTIVRFGGRVIALNRPTERADTAVQVRVFATLCLYVPDSAYG